METGKAFVYEKECTWCGKHFGVMHTDLWAYKRGEKYFCSWKCLRAYDKDKEETPMRKITLEDKKKAVEIAVGGGDPREFLSKKCKNATAMWSTIRQSLKDTDPETYARLPKRIDKPKKVETPEDAVPVAETPEAPAEEEPEKPKIMQPVNYDGMKVREVEGDFARYRRNDVRGTVYIDVEFKDGVDTLSYTVEQWRNIRKEQDKAAAILGVEL